jgi:fumarylacetoacetase
MASTHFDINETHDPNIESWVESANADDSLYPIQNLPFAMAIERDGEDAYIGVVVRIGDMLLDLNALSATGDFDLSEEDWSFFTLDNIAEDGSAPRLRTKIQSLLKKGSKKLRDHPDRDELLKPAEGAELVMPFVIGDYTDFYASLHHATNVGSMFRPDNPLLPNYKWIPIGYHGRASSLMISGGPVRRPKGQLLPGKTIDDGPPEYGPCKLLDYEMEIGYFVGRGNEPGKTISVDEAEDRIFGVCLVNDWSARDIQKWEYQPLGPFLAKSFATTLSPYVVTMEALAPFRTNAFERAGDDPKPLPHLNSERNASQGGIDMFVEVFLASKEMREKGMEPVRLSRGNGKDMYWTPAQMLAHHASNGCNMQTGDLFASGTVSGPTRESRGSLLELSWDGDPFANPPKVVPGSERTPIKLPTGEERKFLADGDEVIMRGYCEREGYRKIGFGECRGIVEAAE